MAVFTFMREQHFKTELSTQRDEAYSSGEKEGYEKGHSDGYADGKKSTQAEISSLKSANQQLSTENAVMRGEYEFFHQNAVIVTAAAGQKYHHYGCGHIACRDYYIFNIEYAKARGYTPCADCFG